MEEKKRKSGIHICAELANANMWGNILRVLGYLHTKGIGNVVFGEGFYGT